MVKKTPARVRNAPENSRAAPVFSPSSKLADWGRHGAVVTTRDGSSAGPLMAAAGFLSSLVPPGFWTVMLVQKPCGPSWSTSPLGVRGVSVTHTEVKLSEQWVTRTIRRSYRLTPTSVLSTILTWDTYVTIWATSPFQHVWTHENDKLTAE